MSRNDPGRKPLTTLEENFVHEVIQSFSTGISKTQCAVKAGYKAKRPEKIASDLMKKPHILYAIEQKMKAGGQNSEITATYVLRKLVENVELAEEKGQMAAAIRGLEIIGKHLGMFKEQVELTGKDGQAIAIEQRTKEDVESFKSAIDDLAKRRGTGSPSLETKH